MPVVIEQPAPQAPDIMAGAGAATQFSRDMPSLAGLYESAGRNYASVVGAGMHATAQLQSAQMQAVAHENAIASQEAQHAAQLQAAHQATQFHADAQSALADQQAMNHAWLNQQEVSQQEAMQMRRMQNAVGALQEAKRNGLFAGPDGEMEFQAALTKLRTGIDPVQQRLEIQHAKLLEEQNKAQIDAATHGLTVQQVATQKRAKDYNAGLYDVTRNGVQGFVDSKGDFQPYQKVDPREGFQKRYLEAVKVLTTKDAITGELKAPSVEEIQKHLQAADDLYNRMHGGRPGGSTVAGGSLGSSQPNLAPLTPAESADHARVKELIAKQLKEQEESKWWSDAYAHKHFWGPLGLSGKR